MKFLAVHPSSLMYSRFFLRLEPLGLELIAEAACQAEHEVKIIDLQVENHKDYFRMIRKWQPDVVGFSCNYKGLKRVTTWRHEVMYCFVTRKSLSFGKNSV
jgi:hopanoid C-3 methylase